jgi:enoyl-CoA hydratase/carnithine racemase
VSRVVAPDDLLSAAHELAERIAANPPHVLRMTKALLRQSQHLSLDAVLELSAGMQAIAHATSDHHEAVGALLDKRPPRFTGQ